MCLTISFCTVILRIRILVQGVMTELVIKNATLEDFDFFLAQAEKEGWNPGLYDAKAFFHTDPHGFFIGYLGKEEVGCISAVAYDNNYGFIGFYIVLPAYRKKGYGLQLWDNAISYLDKRAIGLDGVLAQQKNYEKSRFHLYYKNYRFSGTYKNTNHSTQLVPIAKVPFDLLLHYDAQIFGLQRAEFLKYWIRMPNAYTLAKMKDGHLIGYGVLRSCHKGFKIGPLFADNEDIAKEIFIGLSSKTEGAPLFFDVPEVNAQAMDMAKSFHLKPEFETVRMYTSEPPKQALGKVYGITTFELG